MRRRKRAIRAEQVLRPDRIRRILCYGSLLILLAAAETSFFARLTFLPATPDLMLGAVVAVALLDNRRASTVFAIAAGFVLDAVGGVGVPLSAVIYLIIALCVGAVGEKMLPGFRSYLVLWIPSVLLRGGFGLCELMLLRNTASVGELLWQILLPEAIVTAVLALPLYFIVCLCMLPFRESRRSERQGRI